MKLIALASLFFVFSCSNEESYSQVDMYKIAIKYDPDAKLLLGDLAEATQNQCTAKKYGIGCIRVIRAQVLKLEIVFVQFENTEMARAEAIRLDQYYARNWIIDDIAGEPTLERFMRKVYGAKRPILDEKIPVPEKTPRIFKKPETKP